jgi:hypothetical protein
MRNDLYKWLLALGNENLSEGVRLAAVASGYQERQQQTAVQN